MDYPKLGIYEHYKGGKYRVLGIARNRDTGEEFVLYEPLHEVPEGRFWVRLVSNWSESVEVDGKTQARFKFVSSE